MGIFGKRNFNDNAIIFHFIECNPKAMSAGLLPYEEGDFIKAYPSSKSGSFGSLATFEERNKKFAIKYLNRSWSPDQAELFKKQCKSEYQTLCKLDGLNSCCTASTPVAYAYGEVSTSEDGNRYPAIIMDYIQDPALSTAINNGLISGDPTKQISFQEAIQIAINIAEGYYALQEAGVVYRDGSQENIAVSPQKNHHVTLFDFGNSVNIGTARRTFTRAATPIFGAPEVFLTPDIANRNHPSQDLWTLGALVFFIRSGQMPLEDLYNQVDKSDPYQTYAEIKRDNPLDLMKVLTQDNIFKGDQELAAFILACTQFNIQDRVNTFKDDNGVFSFSCAIKQLKDIQAKALESSEVSRTSCKPEPYKLPFSHLLKSHNVNHLHLKLDLLFPVANYLSLWVDTFDMKKRKQPNMMVASVTNDDIANKSSKVIVADRIQIRVKESPDSLYGFWLEELRQDYSFDNFVLSLTMLLRAYFKCSYSHALDLARGADWLLFDNKSTATNLLHTVTQIATEFDQHGFQLENEPIYRSSEIMFVLKLRSTGTKSCIAPIINEETFKPPYLIKLNDDWLIEARIEHYKKYFLVSRATAMAMAYCNKIMFQSYYQLRSFINQIPSLTNEHFIKVPFTEERFIVTSLGENPSQTIEDLQRFGDFSLSELDANKNIEPSLPFLIWPFVNLSFFAYLLKNGRIVLDNREIDCEIIHEDASNAFYAQGLPSSEFDSLTLDERIYMLMSVAAKQSSEYTIDDYRTLTSFLSKNSRVSLIDLIENQNLSIYDAYKQVVSLPHPWEDSVYETIWDNSAKNPICAYEANELLNDSLVSDRDTRPKYCEDEFESFLKKSYSDFTESDWELYKACLTNPIYSYEANRLSDDGSLSNRYTLPKYQEDKLEFILEKSYSDFTESDWEFVLSQMNESAFSLVMRLTNYHGWRTSSSCIFALDRILYPWKDPQRLNPKYKSVEELPL